MVNKFHYWGLFCTGCVIVVVCFLSFTPVSGDEVMCEEDDEDIGVCLYEGWFFKVREISSDFGAIGFGMRIVEDRFLSVRL